MKNRSMNDEPKINYSIENIINETLSGETPESTTKRVTRHFDAFYKRVVEGELRRSWLRLPALRSSGLKWAGGAGLTLAGVLIALFWMTTFSALGWAQVAERFNSVQYLHATIYTTLNPVKAADKSEIWMDHNGKIRMHREDKVYFAQDGKITQAFNLTTSQEFKPNIGERAERWLEVVAKMRGISLEQWIGSWLGMPDFSAPLNNKDASIDNSLIVFDCSAGKDYPHQKGWLRVWVMKSSGLPVRMCLWNPDYANPNGSVSMEINFDYTKEQAADAFDPAKFKAAALSKPLATINQLYALIKDPGGQALTPAELFAREGYHVPTIKEIGMMPNGIVWVVAVNAKNNTPDGWEAHGFQKLTDDLGQEYLYVFLGFGHEPFDMKTTHEMYIPLDYGSPDLKKPSKLRLTATTRSRDKEFFEYGSVEVKEWKATDRPSYDKEDNIPCPEYFLLKYFRDQRDWKRFDRAIESMIASAPVYETWDREIVPNMMRLDKSMILGRYDEAWNLAQRFWENPKINPEIQGRLLTYDFLGLSENYAMLLAWRGDEAGLRRFVQAVKHEHEMRRRSEEDSPRRDELDRDFDQFMAAVADFMCEKLKWDVDHINSMLGLDVRNENIMRFSKTEFTRPIAGK